MELNKAKLVQEKTFKKETPVYDEITDHKRKMASMIEGIEQQQYIDDNILTAEEAAKMRERSRIRFGIKQIPGETIIHLKQKKRSDRNASKHLIKVPRSLIDTIQWDT